MYITCISGSINNLEMIAKYIRLRWIHRWKIDEQTDRQIETDKGISWESVHIIMEANKSMV